VVKPLSQHVTEEVGLLLEDDSSNWGQCSLLYALAAAVVSGFGSESPPAVSRCLVDGRAAALLSLDNDWLISLSTEAGDVRLAAVHPILPFRVVVDGEVGRGVRATVLRDESEVIQIPVGPVFELASLVMRVAEWSQTWGRDCVSTTGS